MTQRPTHDPQRSVAVEDEESDFGVRLGHDTALPQHAPAARIATNFPVSTPTQRHAALDRLAYPHRLPHVHRAS